MEPMVQQFVAALQAPEPCRRLSPPPSARRGVVRLYNAVAKAQRAQREAAAGGARGRAARLSKAGLLAELRGAAPAPAPAVRAAWALASPSPPWQQGSRACGMHWCSQHAEHGETGCVHQPVCFSEYMLCRMRRASLARFPKRM